jgi:hypothetical protein
MDAARDAGWYDDPDGSGQRRWWDGSSWTDHRRVALQLPRMDTPAPVSSGSRRERGDVRVA